MNVIHLSTARSYGLKNSGDLPEDLIHAATILHGYAFEFIFDKGIFITPAVRNNKRMKALLYKYSKIGFWGRNNNV